MGAGWLKGRRQRKGRAGRERRERDGGSSSNGPQSVLCFTSPQRRLQHPLMEVGKPEDVRLPCGVALYLKLLPQVLSDGPWRGRMLKSREFVAISRFDARKHLQL